MKKQLMMSSIFLAFASFGVNALAQETSSPSESTPAVSSKVKKVFRKRKVEMCSSCGKPESECNCHKKKEDTKDSTENKSTESKI